MIMIRMIMISELASSLCANSQTVPFRIIVIIIVLLETDQDQDPLQLGEMRQIAKSGHRPYRLYQP